MSRTLTRRPTPEERELEKKRTELAALEATLADRELELATLRADLRAFEGRYLRVVGTRLAELDEIEARIAEAEARRQPIDAAARERAERARAQAENSARDAGAAAEPRRPPEFKLSDDLKRLYREVAKRLHPDLATDPEARARRTRLMAEANRAYEEGDAARLQAVLDEWESSPESVKGEGPGAELVRAIRKIAQVETRLHAIEIEVAQLGESDLYELKVKVAEGERGARPRRTSPGERPTRPCLEEVSRPTRSDARSTVTLRASSRPDLPGGRRDLLAEMTSQVDEQIAAARISRVKSIPAGTQTSPCAWPRTFRDESSKPHGAFTSRQTTL